MQIPFLGTLRGIRPCSDDLFQDSYQNLEPGPTFFIPSRNSLDHRYDSDMVALITVTSFFSNTVCAELFDDRMPNMNFWHIEVNYARSSGLRRNVYQVRSNLMIKNGFE